MHEKYACSIYRYVASSFSKTMNTWASYIVSSVLANQDHIPTLQVTSTVLETGKIWSR